MAAIGIYRGPGQVFEYANDELVALLGDRTAYLGKPIAETFPGSHNIQAVYAQSFADGRAYEVDMLAGTLWVVPIIEGRAVVAVASHFVARLQSLAEHPVALVLSAPAG